MKRPSYVSIFGQDPITHEILGGVQWPYSREDILSGFYRYCMDDTRKIIMKIKWKKPYSLKMRIKFTDVYCDFS